MNHLTLPDGLVAQKKPLGMKIQLSTHPLSGKNCASLSLTFRPGWGRPHLLPATPPVPSRRAHLESSLQAFVREVPHSLGAAVPPSPGLNSRVRSPGTPVVLETEEALPGGGAGGHLCRCPHWKACLQDHRTGPPDRTGHLLAPPESPWAPALLQALKGLPGIWLLPFPARVWPPSPSPQGPPPRRYFLRTNTFIF